MKCKGFEKKISDYINGAPGHEDRMELEEHIKVCSRCRKALEDIRKADGLARETMRVEPPAEYWADYWPRVKMKILAEERSAPPERKYIPFFLKYGWKPALAAAAALLLFLGGGRLIWKVVEMREQLRASSMELKDLSSRLAESKSPMVTQYPSGEVALAGGIQKDLMLFRGLEKSFSESIRWVVIDGPKIDLGLSQEEYAEPALLSQPLVFLEFRVFRKDAERHTQLVSSPRIVARNTQEVNAKIETPPEFGLTYRLRSRPRIEGKTEIVVDVDMEFEKSVPGTKGETREFQISTTVTAREGETVTPGSLLLGDDLYWVELVAGIGKCDPSPPSQEDV